MKVKKIVDKTTNRGVFNRAYKMYLESKGKIRCSHCRYHNNENRKGRNDYGGHQKSNGTNEIKFPNWKLVSKNKKQWMDKIIFIQTKSIRRFDDYINITW